MIGGGPAGMAAAVRASRRGTRVGLVDENGATGGQIWRGQSRGGAAARWKARVIHAGVERVLGARVMAAPGRGWIRAETAAGVRDLEYDRLILATGARERFLPFPGWTLPNVLGAGGLQSLVKSGLSIEGKRIVVAGSGPLLLAVAASFRKHGATVPIVAEQASRGKVLRFGLGLAGSPGKLAQALGMIWGLRGVPYRNGCWPVEVKGTAEWRR